MALVAFDDLPPTFAMDAFLTVVSQRAYEMGQIATRLLLKRLKEQEPQGPEEIVLPIDLLVRRSSQTRMVDQLSYKETSLSRVHSARPAGRSRPLASEPGTSATNGETSMM